MRFFVMLTAAALAFGAIVTALAAALGRQDVAAPLFGGMMGPLVAVVVTGIAVVRTQHKRPEGVHGVLMTAFVAKFVFFAVYAVAMVKVFGLDVGAFGVSFATFFIALYTIEAAFFARLFRGHASGAQ